MVFPWIRFSKIAMVALCLLVPVMVQGEEVENDVAILPFEVHMSEPMEHLKQGFQEILGLRLARRGLPVINPDLINQHPKAFLPVIEEKDLVAIGKDLNADWIIKGSFTQIGDKISLNLEGLDITTDRPPLSLAMIEDSLDQLADIAERASAAIFDQMTGVVRIDSIIIKGNKRIETEAILTIIETEKGDGLDAEQLNRDLRAIYRMGYFSDVSIETHDSPTGKIVTFILVEMPSITDIIFEGVKEGKEDDLMEEAGIKLYSIFDRNEVRQSVNRLKEYYRKEGYYNAEIREKIEELPNNSISLTYEIDKGEKIYITKIEFIGNNEFDDDELKDVMMTGEKSILSWFTDSGRLDESMLEFDIQNIGAFYRNHGFIRANAGEAEITVNDEGDLSLTIEITEGSQFRVNEIKVDGDLLQTEALLLTYVSIREGDIFSYEVARQDMEALKTVYADQGYAYADVTPQVSENDETLLVNLTYYIEKAKKVRFERINIVGNTKTKDKVIRRELEVVEGGYFNGTAIRLSSESLNRLGFFDDVEMQTRQGSQDDLMILDVNVTERYNTGSFSFGVAYSGYEGLVGQFSISQENIFGRGQRLSTSVYWGDRTQNISIQFTEPWLYDRDLSGSVTAYIRRRDDWDYSSKSYGGALGVGFPLESIGLGPLTRGSIRVSHDNTDIHDIKNSLSYVIREMAGENVTNSITLGISRDSRDRPFLPNRGSTNSFSVETAGGALSGEVGFNKYQAASTWYFPFPWSTVLMLKGTVGRVKRKGEDLLPVFHKFRIGGVGTVRGFKDYTISPKDPVSGERIGGEKMMYYTVEYRIPLVKGQGITGAFFFDAGNVWTEEEDYSFTGMRMSAGAGVMWYSAMAPISIFYARKLDPHRDESAGELEFSMAGGF